MAEGTQILAPGMEQVVEAGMRYEIQDRDGKTFTVVGREHPQVIAFLKAFDEWLAAKDRGIEGVVFDALQADMTEKFRSLPSHVTDEMPSVRRMAQSIMASKRD